MKSLFGLCLRDCKSQSTHIQRLVLDYHQKMYAPQIKRMMEEQLDLSRRQQHFILKLLNERVKKI